MGTSSLLHLGGRVLLALAVVISMGSGAADATVRYIATSGSDSNSCSASTNPATPKRNFGGGSGAVACMAGGDTLTVGAGTYAEGLANIPNGSSGSPTIIQGVPSKGARLRPNNINTDCIVLFGDNQGWVTIDGLILDGGNGASTRLSGWAVCNTDSGMPMSGANHLTVQNSELTMSRHSGMLIGGTVWNVRNNEIHHNGTDNTFDHGIYFEADHSFIVGNVVHDNACYNLQVYSSAGAYPTVNTITQNVFYGSACGVTLAMGASHVHANNLHYNDGNSSSCALIGFGSNTRVYNNTITGSAGCGLLTNGGGNGDSGAEVRNNIVYNNTGSSQQITTINAILSTNLTTNPNFVNPGAANYQLQAGSPAINTGTTLAAVPTDLLGVTRPQGAGYDIGAYEFGTVPTVVTGTYYMSLTGSDAVACSAATNPLTPMRSFNVVLACMGSGSTLYLRAGTYTAAGDRLDSTTMTIVGGTSFTQPTTIAAFPGETVILAPPLTGTTPMVNLAASGNAYLILDRLQFAGNGVVDRGVVISGLAHHIRVQNAIMAGLLRYCFHVDGTADNELLNSTCKDNGAAPHVLLTNGARGILIQNNDLFNFGSGGVQDHSLTGTTNSTNFILRNRIHDSQVGSATPGLIVGFGNNTLVANNQIWNISGGIKIGPNHTAPKVYYNTVTHTTGEALTVDATVTSAQVINNIVWANATDIIDNSGTALRLTNLGPGTNPFFTNEAGHDYTLLPTSPAINAGTSATTAPGLAVVTTDAVGTLRPQGVATDIGALEFVGTVPTAPSGPTNLRITATTIGPIDSVALAWDYTPTDLYRGTYVLYRQPNCTGTFVRINVSLIRAATLAYTDNVVQPGTTYCWLVRALDASGVESVSSNTVQYAAAAYVPGTLGMSVALLGGPTVYTARLTWTFTNGTPATVGFNAYRYDNCGVSGRTKLNGSLLATSTLILDDSAVQNGKSHCWVVAGQDVTGKEVLFSGLVSLPVPNVPGVVGLHGAGSGQSGMMGGVRR